MSNKHSHLLMSDDAQESYTAAIVIGKSGRSGLPVLIAASQDMRPWVRCNAASGLAMATDPCPLVINTLIAMLRDESEYVTREACVALATHKESAAPAVSQLTAMLNSANPSIVEASAYAIRGIGSMAHMAEEHLAEVAIQYIHICDMISYEALRALESIRIRRLETIHKLSRLLDITDQPVVIMAIISAIGNANCATSPAHAVLKRYLISDDLEIQLSAIIAWGRTVNADEAIEALYGSLRHHDEDVRLSAVVALAMIGDRTAKCVSQLQNVASCDNSPIVRDSAESALDEIRDICR